MPNSKITEFEQLDVWQNAQDIAVRVYKASRRFPNEERFSLVDQIRRSSSSISANIAEGFGRQSRKEKVQFYSIAYGSLLETRSHLHLAIKLRYLDDANIQNLLDNIKICQKQLNSLIRAIKNG